MCAAHSHFPCIVFYVFLSRCMKAAVRRRNAVRPGLPLSEILWLSVVKYQVGYEADSKEMARFGRFVCLPSGVGRS